MQALGQQIEAQARQKPGLTPRNAALQQRSQAPFDTCGPVGEIRALDRLVLREIREERARTPHTRHMTMQLAATDLLSAAVRLLLGDPILVGGPIGVVLVWIATLFAR